MEEIFEIANSLSDNLIEIISDDELTTNILNMGAETLETGIPVFKLARKLISSFKILKFRSFLKGINSACNNNKKTGKDLGELLISYSKKKLYSDYIVNIYEAAENAKSLKNTAVLGYYLAYNAFHAKNVTLEELIIANSLRELTDTETEMFLYIYNFVKEKDGLKYFNPNEMDITNFDIYSIQLMIEGLKNHRIVSRGIGAFDVIEQFGVCIFTETTRKFYDILKDSCVYNST
jgi:hypothetical protein